MRVLSKKEWVVLAVVIVIVIFFLGARFIMNFNKGFSGNSGAAAVQGTDSTNDLNVNNNMNQSNSTNSNGPIIKDVVVGTGAEAKNGDVVSVQYTGKFADGKVFDSSVPRGAPIEFTLGVGRVIKGWDVGLLGMKVGGISTLEIPSDFGYGRAG